eukprot:CAMPEP_0170542204 /NCGR_PEP_ID=MMETSP0211-20121228/1705_1 /TAXON_ID=311385 /ORGANISM="Pseudokeronopsis sp., Strain OXSARD2" /LENGTH=37 /DNA_ID= /DNA_START= /DNA_END= /DNA_ORIENTATION=
MKVRVQEQVMQATINSRGGNTPNGTSKKKVMQMMSPK